MGADALIEEILAELRAANASLHRIEVGLLTKPRAIGRNGHRLRYADIAEAVKHANRLGVIAEIAIRSRLKWKP